MLKSGNGKAKQCVENLIQIVRGEIPFDRVRGINARIVDKPSNQAAEEYQNDIKWNIETYEPRVNYGDTNVVVTESLQGEFELKVEINE